MLQAAPHATHFKRILNFGEGQVNINYAMRNSAELSVMARQKATRTFRAAIKILQLNWFVESTTDAFFCGAQADLRANPSAKVPKVPMTSADPRTARARGPLPRSRVCNSTPSGKRKAPSKALAERSILIRSENARRSRPIPNTIKTIARPIQWPCASTCRS